jgi:hypothetical protein
VTGIRRLLFLFPNLFENFYLYYVVARRFFPKYAVNNPSQLGIVLFILLLPELAQEWVLHVQEIKPWDWLKRTLLE